MTRGIPRRLLPLLLLAALPAQAAVFRVTKTADTLDGACDADCSLREAVVAANARHGTAPACAAAEEALCLGNRFRVTARWTARGASEDGRAVPLTPDTGAFWFFAPDNLEMMIKVLDGCGLNQRFWVFLSGLTDVQVDVAVVDSVTGERWEHRHAGGSALPTRLDTTALAGCSAADPAVGGKDAILLGPGVYSLTREGRGEDASATGDLDVEGDLAILGAGAGETILDGGGIDRVLHLQKTGSLEVHDATIRNGWAQDFNGDGGYGGGILAAGALRLEHAAVSGNRARTNGGGIHAGHLTLAETTVSGNAADGFGGGIYGAWLRMTNSTVSGNRAEFAGGILVEDFDAEIDQSTITGNTAKYVGGLWRSHDFCIPEDPCDDPPGRFVLNRSIVAGNSQASGPSDCTSLEERGGGHNVLGTDAGCAPAATDRAGTVAAPLAPRLSPLGDHGGPTPTHLPLAGSPAIDAAGETCPATDQRGAARSAGASCDAGAVETGAICIPGPDRLCLQNGRFAVTARWSTQGTSGPGQTRPLTADTGAFWFFDRANLEMMIKVLDGCGVNGRYWVFLSGLTDVAVDVLVEDTQTGATWQLGHGPGPLQPVLDTDALHCVHL